MNEETEDREKNTSAWLFRKVSDRMGPDMFWRRHWSRVCISRSRSSLDSIKYAQVALTLVIQIFAVFFLGYGLSKWGKLDYEDAAPTSMIGALKHFEVAIATATMLFGLSSGAALATVVGVLIEVPIMLTLVRICRDTKSYFSRAPQKAPGTVTK
jgi:predicted Na+-dependent transporter